MPFHAYVEAFGCVVETAGLLILPLAFFTGAIPISFFWLLLFLAVGYGTLLSMVSVLLAEATIRRYPKYTDMLTLVVYAFLENIGFRQAVSLARAQGVLQFFTGSRRWEVVEHEGVKA